ncbi:MAG: NLP/P60-family protein [Parcubacteria group bacterium GW2011_GWA2_47_8]|nr:MAG: NLP/P60-family protein [Parcubacteria group bacterium GW2011_GWA2_47_8]OHB19657.1 MAG: hypothetical protein A2666_03905 [Parcubacteria group bacterium RIFCSPHIGHO2_01_FULL_47_10b]
MRHELIEKVISAARSCIGHARYRRSALLYHAPQIVNCWTLTKWVYGQAGIVLPDYPVEQRQFCVDVTFDERVVGDLIFRTSVRNTVDPVRGDSVGHVGIITGRDMVIHATNRERRNGVFEESLGNYLKDYQHRGVGRFVVR